MTRFIYDQFFKDCLDGFLNKCGSVEIDKRVTSEVMQIDVWFVPNPELSKHRETLGLLGRMAATRAIFEPFHSAATPDEICDCMVKLRYVCSQEKREANRTGRKVAWEEYPRLWVLTPTASKSLLSEFSAKLDNKWMPGVYFLPKTLRTAIVVLHKLPETPETLWLRLLGKGTKQQQAIKELQALPPDHPNRQMTLDLLVNFRDNLAERQDLDSGGKRFVMQLKPLLDMKLEDTLREGEQRGIQQGALQERRAMLQNLLVFRFGDLDPELTAIVEQMLALPPADLTSLIMQLSQLSRGDLLARFPELSQ